MGKIKKISFVNLYSKNVSKLIEFYTNILGLKALSDNEENWFGFDTGKTTFALEPEENRKAYNFTFNKKNPILIQFQVNSLKDLKKITKDLEQKGIKIRQKLLKKSYGTITNFLDPDRNVIELLVENKK